MKNMHHIGYKKIRDDYIVKLAILPDGINNECRNGVERKNAKYAKYRCSKAKVLDIYNKDTGERVDVGYSIYDKYFSYKVGEIVEVKNYDEELEVVCTRGIHYFLSEECAYFFDKYTGFYKSWYENGQLAIQTTYGKNGQNDGLYETWHENGQLRSRTTYKNGVIDGVSKLWDKNGQLCEQCYYNNGLLDGEHLEWSYITGKYLKTTYKNGVEIV